MFAHQLIETLEKWKDDPIVAQWCAMGDVLRIAKREGYGELSDRDLFVVIKHAATIIDIETSVRSAVCESLSDIFDHGQESTDLYQSIERTYGL